MQALLAALGSLRLWQVGVLAAALVAAAGASYGVYALASRSNGDALGEDEQLIPVQYGDLVNQVLTSGSLVFSTRETLSFDAAGTVREVMVEEGQRVEEGDPLAMLDAASVASMRRMVAEGEASVASAKVALKEARDALNQLSGQPVADGVAEVQSAVDLAQVSLANAQRDLELAQREWAGKLRTAQEAFDDSTGGYRDVFRKWFGVELSSDEADRAPDELLASWNASLDALFTRDERSGEVRSYLMDAIPLNNPATRWSETVVYLWLTYYPGAIVANCEDGVAPPQGACVQSELDAAWDSYEQAKDGLDATKTQEEKAVASAQSAVTKAEDSLATAEEELAEARLGPDPLEVELNRKELTVAEATLAQAEEDLAKLMRRIGPLLDDGVLRASMAGVVSLVGVEAGQTVNANTSAFELVDVSIVEIDGIVDEIDVLFVQVGAQAEVTMDALPGQVLTGEVSAISQEARNQQGVVSYPIRIRVEAPAGVEFREGLSATASIVIREERNVLLVPVQALYGTFEQPVVKVAKGDGVEDRSVILGNSDDFWVAVHEGLVEGDQVVMQAPATSPFGFFGGPGVRQIQFSGAVPGSVNPLRRGSGSD